MRTTHVLVTTVAASLALAASSFAATGNAADVSLYLEHYKVLRTDVPLPLKIVAPEGLPRSLENTTVNVTMLIDESGRPQNIEIVSPVDRRLAELLKPALAQWRFSPALKDGVPVPQKVTLPIRLV